MTTTIVNLSPDLQRHYNITEIHSTKRGGQKIVFIVTKDCKKCVLKLFHNFGKRDIRELEIYEKFKNLNGIPKIISIDDFQGDKVVFEEFIDGSSLQDIASSYAGDAEKIRSLIINITSILAPIWEDNKIHRDLKPNNIMINNKGEPVVIDFGIAQDLTGTIYTTHFIPNSWDFASPEQLLGQRDQIDYRSDFFNLGLIAYTLYFQHRPFGDNETEVKQKFQLKNTFQITDQNCKFNLFFKECLGNSPADRPRDLKALLDTLQW